MSDVTVGLVDGDAMVRSWVRRSLDGSEFRVVAEARNAVEALQVLETVEPDLLLVESQLPDHRGTELVLELRRRGVTAPAVWG